MRSRPFSFEFALLFVLAACGGSGSTGPSQPESTNPTPNPPAPTPTSTLTIIVDDPVVSGTTVQATATITTPSGQTSTATGVTWRTLNPSGVSVSNDGMITGKLMGVAPIIATSGTLTARFDVHVVPGPPTLLTVWAGNGQSGFAGVRLNDPLCTLVQDAAGNPVTGVAVTYTVVSGGGVIAAPTTPMSDAGGVAISGLWTLGPNTGTQTVKASLNATTSVTFTATAR